MERFEDIYQRYYSKVLSYLLSRVRPPEDAEDVCSEVFEKVLRGLNTYDENKGAISTWIYRIAHNAILDHARKRHPTEELDESLVSGELIDDTLLRSESLTALSAALERLDEDERDVIVLHYYEGYTLRAISERTGIPYRTVIRREQRALSMLKYLLKDFA
ncbi:MAG: sigma-70 family RNA polymerase sigma factor [Oscillospiraceae bacterium]|nr:sigma-70 family RNA polymerase sigma factor [Oscillospiraceae bacterium]